MPKSQWSETQLFRDPKTGRPLSYTHMPNLLRHVLSKLEGLPNPNLFALHSIKRNRRHISSNEAKVPTAHSTGTRAMGRR